MAEYCCPTCGCTRPMQIGQGVIVDVPNRTVTHGGRDARLTLTASLIVQRLAAARPGQPVSKWDLVDHIYGDRGVREPAGVDEVVRSKICLARQRLRPLGLRIQNERGEGYRLEVATDATQ